MALTSTKKKMWNQTESASQRKKANEKKKWGLAKLFTMFLICIGIPRLYKVKWPFQDTEECGLSILLCNTIPFNSIIVPKKKRNRKMNSRTQFNLKSATSLQIGADQPPHFVRRHIQSYDMTGLEYWCSTIFLKKK